MEETLYKILHADGSPCNGGKGKWPLPRGKKPGEWLSVEGKLIPCQHGLHLCRVQDLSIWLVGEHLYTAAYSGEVLVHNDTKLVVRKARLLSLVGVWKPGLSVLFAENCADNAAQYAQYAAQSAQYAVQYAQYARKSAQYAQYAAQHAAQNAAQCARKSAQYAGYAGYAQHAAQNARKSAQYAQYAAQHAAQNAQNAEAFRQGELILELARKEMLSEKQS